jgi:WD40 repeat protein
MDDAKLRQLITQPEGVKLEFKRDLYRFVSKDERTHRLDGKLYDPQWHEFLKDIISLANGNIGTAHEDAYLIIGVEDKTKILVGVNTSNTIFERKDSVIRKQIIDKLGEVCEQTFQNLFYETQELDGKKLIVITIPPSDALYELKTRLKPNPSARSEGFEIKTVFLRRGDGERIYVSTDPQARKSLEFEKKHWRTSIIYRNLTSPEYIDKAIERDELPSLIKQYSKDVDDNNPLERQYILRLIQATLTCSKNVLSENKKQLANQLIGRLLFCIDPDIKIFLDELKKWQFAKRENWLEPLSSSLEPPITFPLKTLSRHSKKPAKILYIDSNSSRLISASPTDSLNVWDLNVWDLSQDKILDPIFRKDNCRFDQLLITSDSTRPKLIILNDSRISILEINTGHSLFELEHSDTINSICLTPDNKSLISASDDCELRIWSLADGTSQILHTASDPITDAVVTNDGKYIFFSSDTFIAIWDLDTNIMIDQIEAHDRVIDKLYVLSNQDKILSLSQDDDIAKIWDLEGTAPPKFKRKPRESTQISDHSQDYTCSIERKFEKDLVRKLLTTYKLAIPYDKQIIIYIDDGKDLAVWDSQSNQLSSFWPYSTIDPFTERIIHDFAITPNGKWLITASSDDIVEIWDVANRQSIKKIPTDNITPLTLSITPDGEKLIVVFDDKSLEIWYLLNSQLVHSSNNHTRGIKSIKLILDEHGERLALSISEDSLLKKWRISDGNYLQTFKPDELYDQSEELVNWISASAFDAQKLLFASGRNGKLTIEDLSSPDAVKTLDGHSKTVNKIIIIPGTSYAISASQDECSISKQEAFNLIVWDLESKTLYKNLEGHTFGVDTIAINSEKKILVSASVDRTLIWNLETFELLYTFSGQSESVKQIDKSVRIFPEEQYTICQSEDSNLKIWNSVSGELFFMLPGRKEITAMAIASDCSKVISTCSEISDTGSRVNYALEIWKTDDQTKSSSKMNAEHSDEITSIALTLSNRYAISASRDCTVKVWDLKDEKLITSFAGDGPLTTCTLSDDDMTIIAGEQSGRIHFLKLQGLPELEKSV